MAASKGEARGLIEQGGVKLNDQPVQSVTAAISGADLDERGNGAPGGRQKAPRVDQARVAASAAMRRYFAPGRPAKWQEHRPSILRSAA